MIAKWSDSIFRPLFAAFILTLLFIFCLTTGCAVKNPPPVSDIFNIPEKDAAEAGSMALYMQGLLHESATNATPDDAIDAYSNALKLNPYNEVAFSSLVNVLSQQKRFDEAYTALSTYLDNFPENNQIRLYAAQLADYKKMPAEAAAFCQQVLVNTPTNAVVARAAIKYHFEGGEDKQALKTLDHFTASLEKSEALKFSVDTVLALFRIKDKTTSLPALKCSEKALQFASDGQEISDVLMLQAYCQLETAQTNKAIRTFENSYRANPKNHVPLAHLGRIHASQPELLKQLKDKNKEEPTDDLPLNLILGYAYLTLERPEDAADVMEAHYNENMRRGYFADRDFYLTLGSTYEEFKAYDRFDRLFKDAICAYPDDPQILNFAAYLWSEREVNLPQALRCINIVLQQEPTNPAYLDTRGWILHKQGRHFEALQQLLKACAVENQEAVILDHTGDVLFKVGNDILALDFWKKSYINAPLKSVADKLIKNGETVPRVKKR